MTNKSKRPAADAPSAPSATRPSRRRSVRGEGRQRILIAALNLFADQGYDSTSTADIAHAAGCSQSVVLYHFATKDDLWRDAMRHLFTRLDGRPAIDSAYASLPARERFALLLRRFVHASARVPQLGRVIFREGLSGGPRLEWLVAELAMPHYAMFLDVIDELQADGLMGDWDPVALTLAIHGAGATIYNLSHLHGRLSGGDPFAAAAIERQADLLIHAFSGGLVRPET